MFDSIRELLHLKQALTEKREEISTLDQRIAEKQRILREAEQNVHTHEAELKDILESRNAELQKTQVECERVIAEYAEQTTTSKATYEEALASQIKLETKLKTQASKLASMKTLCKAVQFAVDHYDVADPSAQLGLTQEELAQIDELVPSAILPLESDDIQDLRRQNKENTKRLEDLLARYEKRYTTKGNKAIYQLMVIALRAELQNILTDIKFNKLDACLDNLKNAVAKYLKIASDGSQTIAPTLNKFIAEIHVIFEALVRTEYEYYVRKERARAEQQALREQMRQEAEERKLLEQQQKQIEREESKYQNEIQNIQQQLNTCTDDTKNAALKQKILELQAQLTAIAEQKEEIIKRQNGKAGYVYVISNLGAFGDNTFKIGMTRRLDPMERIKELGSASVPFPFDVHSFIFSDDAVGLESALHNRLDQQRMNKINLRKEFFKISIDQLEQLVQEINPAAEFKRTMLATEFRQSQSV